MFIEQEIPPNVMRARYKGYYVLPPLVDLQAIVPPDNILKYVCAYLIKQLQYTTL